MMPRMISASARKAFLRSIRAPLPSQFLVGILSAALVPALLSCNGPCGQERERTRESLGKARAARAGIYSPDTFAKAAGLADEADTECRGQEKRFLPLRSYSRALGLHAEARRVAEKAAKEGSINEGMVRQEALNARYVAVQSVEEARASISRARKAKGDSAAGDLMEGWTLLRRALTEVQGRIDRGDYLSARDLGERIARESSRLQTAANRRARGLPARAPGMDGLY